MSAEPIIYGLIFIGVLVLVEGLYLVAFGKSISMNSRVNRRLEMLNKGGRREEILDQLRKEMRQHMSAKSSHCFHATATFDGYGRSKHGGIYRLKRRYRN